VPGAGRAGVHFAEFGLDPVQCRGVAVVEVVQRGRRCAFVVLAVEECRRHMLLPQRVQHTAEVLFELDVVDIGEGALEMLSLSRARNRE